MRKPSKEPLLGIGMLTDLTDINGRIGGEMYSNSRNGATPSFSINLQHLSHRFAFQRSPAVHRFAYLWSHWLSMSKKKELHHCGNY